MGCWLARSIHSKRWKTWDNLGTGERPSSLVSFVHSWDMFTTWGLSHPLGLLAIGIKSKQSR